MREPTRSSIDIALRDASQELNGLTGGALQRTVQQKARQIDGDLECYIDDHLPNRGQIDYLSKDARHIGLATTLHYEQGGQFQEEYLQKIPWVGYGATVKEGDLNGADISVPRAFHGALFEHGSMRKTRWLSHHQAHYTVVENGALHGALIARDTKKNFYGATFRHGSATSSQWYGEDNAHNVTIPTQGFLENIRIDGDNNFHFQIG